MMSKIKVLVVDDSALMRQLISEILSADPELEVVGTAGDPFQAREKILRLNPDVLTLDVEMPRMDGLTFLEKLMVGRPMPVVMLSSLTAHGCQTTMRALELGAVDFITKPKIDVVIGMEQLCDDIRTKVKVAARAKVQQRSRVATTPQKAPLSANDQAMITTTHKVIAIGTSTGGTEALLQVLSTFPSDAPGVVAVIHMPPGFTHSYAERLDRHCNIRVKEAEDGDRILPGHALLAPGGLHTEVRRSGAVYSVRIHDSPPVNRHKPSVNVLFDSCAKYLGPNAVGAILTGMGNDGADGLLRMKQAGAFTVAQNEQTCVVFGMPREAIALGAADDVLPLKSIADRVLQAAQCAVLA